MRARKKYQYTLPLTRDYVMKSNNNFPAPSDLGVGEGQAVSRFNQSVFDVPAHFKSSRSTQQYKDIRTRQMARSSSGDHDVVVSGSRCIRQSAPVSLTPIYRESTSRSVQRRSSHPSHVRMVGGRSRRPFVRRLVTVAETEPGPTSICLASPLRKI